MRKSAPPLKWPMPLASATVPSAAEPCGTTTLPPSDIGSATVPVKLSPALAVLVLMVSPSRTVIMVPAGSVALDAPVMRCISEGDLPSPFSDVDCCSSEGLLPQPRVAAINPLRSEEHTSELQSRVDLVCRLLLEKKKKKTRQ